MSKYTEAMDFYSVLMHEAKRRLLAMDTALEGKTGLPEVAVREYCFLQLRMLCELIALGCLTAQGDLQTGKLKDEYRQDNQAPSTASSWLLSICSDTNKSRDRASEGLLHKGRTFEALLEVRRCASPRNCRDIMVTKIRRCWY